MLHPTWPQRLGHPRAPGRPLGAVLAAALLLASLSQGGCKSARPPTGFGVNLTIDAQPLSARAEIVDLLLSTAGAETYSRTIDVREVVPNDGMVRVRYVPGVESGELSFSLVARDASGTTRGLGADTVTLVAGAAVDRTIALSDVGGGPDGGAPADMLPAECTNGALDPGEFDIDCGGTCPLCEPGRKCTQPEECATHTCLNGHCELASGPPSWVPITSLPAPRAFAAAFALEDGRIYVAGGRVTDPEASVLAYSQATNDWTAAPSLPAPREQMPAVVVAEKVFLPGGIFSPTAGTYDSYASIVGSAGSPPTFATLARVLGGKRAQAGAAQGSDGLIYVVGGSAYPDTTSLDTVFSFDPANDAAGPATQVPAPLPMGRGELAVAPDARGRIVAVGGRIAADAVVGNTDLYDPSQGSWSAGPVLGTPRRRLGAALGGDGRVYAIGGMDMAGVPFEAVEALTNDGARWLSLPALTPARHSAAVTRGWDGRIYAIGGEGMGARSADVAAYGPRIAPGPATGAPGAVIALSCKNFAANAKVSVTFSGDVMGKIAASGMTNDAGDVVPSLVWQVPPVVAGSYILTATDDRSRYTVRARFVVP